MSLRRIVVVVGAVFASLIVAGRVAWAANTIQCPNDPENSATCWGRTETMSCMAPAQTST